MTHDTNRKGDVPVPQAQADHLIQVEAAAHAAARRTNEILAAARGANDVLVDRQVDGGVLVPTGRNLLVRRTAFPVKIDVESSGWWGVVVSLGRLVDPDLRDFPIAPGARVRVRQYAGSVAWSIVEGEARVDLIVVDADDVLLAESSRGAPPSPSSSATDRDATNAGDASPTGVVQHGAILDYREIRGRRVPVLVGCACGWRGEDERRFPGDLEDQIAWHVALAREEGTRLDQLSSLRWRSRARRIPMSHPLGRLRKFAAGADAYGLASGWTVIRAMVEAGLRAYGGGYLGDPEEVVILEQFVLRWHQTETPEGILARDVAVLLVALERNDERAP